MWPRSKFYWTLIQLNINELQVIEWKPPSYEQLHERINETVVRSFDLTSDSRHKMALLTGIVENMDL